MTIDGRSLLAVVAALCVVFSIVVLALERRLRQPMPGLRLWAISNLLLAGADRKSTRLNSSHRP